MAEIVTVGEILVEIMTKNTGQEFTQQGELLGPYPSGAPAIFIDQAAKMGVSCRIIARVGEDDFGLLNINRLKADGVDTSRIYSMPGYTTGSAFVTYMRDGSRKFIFHFTHSAAGRLSSDDIDEACFQGTKYLHIMGCSLTASEGMRGAITKSVSLATSKGVKISFDPNIRPELLRETQIRKVFDDVLQVTDIFLTSESEILLLTGCSNIQEAVTQMKACGIRVVVTKNGSKGARVYCENVDFLVPAFSVAEVDPTGAGDCFDGAFIASLVQGKSLEEATWIANAAGALSVTRKGPMEGTQTAETIFEFIMEQRRSLYEKTDPDHGID